MSHVSAEERELLYAQCNAYREIGSQLADMPVYRLLTDLVDAERELAILRDERIYHCEKCGTPFQHITNEECLKCRLIDAERERDSALREVEALREALERVKVFLGEDCKTCYGGKVDWLAAALARMKEGTK